MSVIAMNTPIPGLHDIHLPASPGWWPPAPGWWVLAALLVATLAWSVRRMARSQRHRHRVADAMFEYDGVIEGADSPPARLAAASALLRRAAKSHDPSAALLAGDAWLRFLDGSDPSRPFSQGQGSLLADGAFRRVLDADSTGALALARARFAALLQPGESETNDA